MSYDAIIVGAGVAGLAAARVLRRARARVAILEAGSRIGGRAWTVRPPALGGAHFEMGAIWLHAAATNPLAPIARAAGIRLIDADARRTRRTYVDARLANREELADYTAAWDRYEAMADRLLAESAGDLPLSAVAARLQGDPWAKTVETWEGPIICVADADRFSLTDWKRNILADGNLLPAGGLGDMVARALAPEDGLWLTTPAQRIRWGSRDVAVETPRGTLEARAAIVTVSTGVLAGGSIAFDPPLPAPVQAALEGLPMGLALKVVLRAAGADRLGLPEFCGIDRQFRDGDPAIVFSAWPWGFPYVSAWIGGGLAWALERAGEGAAADFARAELRKLLGGVVDRAFAPSAAVVSRWGADPLFRGAYAYATPGQADAREALGAPLANGRLALAGEATHPNLAGTVGGAFESGEAAARRVLQTLAG